MRGQYLPAGLGDLVRAAALELSQSAGGGFRWARPARELRFSEVFAAFEPVLAHRRSCPLGQERCSDDDVLSGAR